MTNLRRLTAFWTLALNILPRTSSISVPNAMPKLVVFGDSISDNGKKPHYPGQIPTSHDVGLTDLS